MPCVTWQQKQECVKGYKLAQRICNISNDTIMFIFLCKVLLFCTKGLHLQFYLIPFTYECFMVLLAHSPSALSTSDW